MPTLTAADSTPPRILYALAGEGRGHSTRAKSVSDAALRRGARIVFLTGGDAIGFLRDCYDGDSRVQFIEVPVPRFAYADKGHHQRVHLRRTVYDALRYAARLKRLSAETAARLKALDFYPDIILSDYEPLSSRVAKRIGVPLITVDNQHFFVYVRMAKMPLHMWPFVLIIRLTCRLFSPNKQGSLISKFTPDEYLRRGANVRAVGPLIRDELRALEARRTDDGFLLCYLRPSVEVKTLDALRRLNQPALVYGLGERPAEGPIEFRAVSSEEFMGNLARCRKVIASAGNQMITECLYMEKPFFVIPEPGQMEQAFNAFMARRVGGRAFRRDMFEELKAFIDDEQTIECPFLDDGAEQTAEIVLEWAGKGDSAIESAGSRDC